MLTCTVTNLDGIDTEGSLLYVINQINLGNFGGIIIGSELNGTYNFSTLGILTLLPEETNNLKAIAFTHGESSGFFVFGCIPLSPFIVFLLLFE